MQELLEDLSAAQQRSFMEGAAAALNIVANWTLLPDLTLTRTLKPRNECGSFGVVPFQPKAQCATLFFGLCTLGQNKAMLIEGHQVWRGEERGIVSWLIRTVEEIVLPIRLYLGHKYMHDENRTIVKISPNRLIKGPVHIADYEAMMYVAEHTDVPVPKVHRLYHRKDGLYIEREFVNGVMLDTIWNGLADSEKKRYVVEIWKQLSECREHGPPPSLKDIAVASISGGSLKDGALSLYPVGPYSMKEFEDSLRSNPNTFDFPPGWKTSDSMRRIVLTNGDVALRNVVVRNRGQPNSICMIDWESGGWWPAYWEAVKWHFSDFAPGAMEGWLEMMDEVSEMSGSEGLSEEG